MTTDIIIDSKKNEIHNLINRIVKNSFTLNQQHVDELNLLLKEINYVSKQTGSVVEINYKETFKERNFIDLIRVDKKIIDGPKSNPTYYDQQYIKVSRLNIKQIYLREALYKHLYIDLIYLYEGDFSESTEINEMIETHYILKKNSKITFDKIVNKNFITTLNCSYNTYFIINDYNSIKEIRSTFHIIIMLISYIKYKQYFNNKLKELLIIKLSKQFNKKILNVLYDKYNEYKITSNEVLEIIQFLNITKEDIICFLNTILLKYNRKIKDEQYQELFNFLPNSIYKTLDFNKLYILTEKKILLNFIKTKPTCFELIPINYLKLLETKDWSGLLEINPSLSRRLLEIKEGNREINTLLKKHPDIAIHLIP